jgi:hypothetical protein
MNERRPSRGFPAHPRTGAVQSCNASTLTLNLNDSPIAPALSFGADLIVGTTLNTKSLGFAPSFFATALSDVNSDALRPADVLATTSIPSDSI